MLNSQKYRDQHDKILIQVKEIDTQVATKKVAGLSRILGTLAGSVKMHLAMEDNSLYPRLINGSDKEIAKLAVQFQKEMGGIAQVFVAFIEKYNVDQKIESQFEDFKKEFETLKKVLGERIQKENNQLYSAYDSVAS